MQNSDAHAHPHTLFSIDVMDRKKYRLILRSLSKGIINLTAKQSNPYILDYDTVLRYVARSNLWADVIHTVDFVTARVTYDDSIGWITRGQEIDSLSHITGIGLDKFVPDYRTLLDAVNAIHDQGDCALISHPYWLFKKNGVVSYSSANVTLFSKLCYCADEIELFDAVNVPYAGFPSWSSAMLPLSLTNDFAQHILAQTPFEGMVVSDTHKVFSSLRCTGVFLPASVHNSLSWDKLAQAIDKKQFRAA